MDKFVITFPPDYDGCLIVHFDNLQFTNQIFIQFEFTFNHKPNETPREAFFRMCREVAAKGK